MKWIVGFLLATAIICGGCGGGGGGGIIPPASKKGIAKITVTLTEELAKTRAIDEVTAVTVSVTGAGYSIPKVALTKNTQTGAWEGSQEVPADNLLFAAEASDSTGKVLYSGQAQMKIIANITNDVAITIDVPAPPKNWDVKQNGNILEVAYGNGQNFPQYAALHIDSGYLRLINSPTAGWGTSVVVVPSFWENSINANWKEVASPGKVFQLRALHDQLIALTNEGLFKSGDSGISWQQISVGLTTGAINSMDIDQDKLYLACRNGVAISTNEGASFQWSLSWSWDSCNDIDFQDGFGWAAINNWGAKSGPNQKTPDSPDWILRRGDLPWAYMSTRSIIADPLDPDNVAYLNSMATNQSYRTLDGGKRWLPSLNYDKIVYAFPSGSRSLVFSERKFSEDQGETWQPIGLSLDTRMSSLKNVIVRDDTSGLFYAASFSKGVFSGQPGKWTPLGMSDQYVHALAIQSNQLFAATSEGKMFRISTAETAKPVLRQGAPIATTWRVDGTLLKIQFSGDVYGLNTTGEITLFPPESGSITAKVAVSASGDINLASKPNEAFKPVMLSSMRISDAQWDCSESFIGLTTNQIPAKDWLVPSAITGTLFGLKGGSSGWKQNAPTVAITLDSPMPITGWVTPSSDPNDDNVGMWPASDSVMRSWSYTIKVESQ